MSEFIVSAPPDVDLSKKMPWDERLKIIQSMYPSTARLDWVEVFRADPQILGKFLAEIMKHESESTGRPGKRKAADPADAARHLRRYENDDYTILEFKEALKVLKGDRSIRHMANKCGTTSTMMQRLLEGRAQPTHEIIESVARAFKKHPSYFVEHRIGYVVAMIVERMEAIPEASIVPYLKLRGTEEKSWK